MKQEIRIYSKILFIISIICFAVFCEGCRKHEDSLENKKMAKELAYKMKELLSKPNQEAIVLLSVKYGKDVNTVEEIVYQYLTETDFAYRMKKSQNFQKNKHDIEIALGALDKSAYIGLINQLSYKFTLEPSLVASILFDYKLWAINKEAVQPITSRD